MHKSIIINHLINANDIHGIIYSSIYQKDYENPKEQAKGFEQKRFVIILSTKRTMTLHKLHAQLCANFFGHSILRLNTNAMDLRLTNLIIK